MNARLEVSAPLQSIGAPAEVIGAGFEPQLTLSLAVREKKVEEAKQAYLDKLGGQPQDISADMKTMLEGVATEQQEARNEPTQQTKQFRRAS